MISLTQGKHIEKVTQFGVPARKITGTSRLRQKSLCGLFQSNASPLGDGCTAWVSLTTACVKLTTACVRLTTACVRLTGQCERNRRTTPGFGRMDVKPNILRATYYCDNWLQPQAVLPRVPPITTLACSSVTCNAHCPKGHQFCRGVRS